MVPRSFNKNGQNVQWPVHLSLMVWLLLFAQPALSSPHQDKLQRQHNLRQLWLKVDAHPTAVASRPAARAVVKKHQRQATLALLNRGIIPGDPLLSWAPLATDELLREHGSPLLLARLESIVARLKAQIGLPYRWGGQTPTQGFDCSGLVWFAFRDSLNWPLPRTARGLFAERRLKPVVRSKLRRGDLLFFKIERSDAPDHVGVYLGNHQFIEAPRTGLSIRISDLDMPFWQRHFVGARRVLLEENLKR